MNLWTVLGSEIRPSKVIWERFDDYDDNDDTEILVMMLILQEFWVVRGCVEVYALVMMLIIQEFWAVRGCVEVYALVMMLILCFRSSELYVDVLRCMHMVLHRTEVRRWEMFSDMFNSLCILVSNPTGQGRWPYKWGSKICSLDNADMWL